jgi:hypothetical protein
VGQHRSANLAPAQDRAIRATATVAVMAVAAIAAIASYRHVYELAVRNGETGTTARILPLTVDGLIFAASIVMLQAARRGQRAPWLAWMSLAVGIVATLAANVSHGLAYGWVGALVAAWPALALVLSYELLMGMIRTGRRRVRHVICAGSDGVLTLDPPPARRRSGPRPEQMEPAGPVGERVGATAAILAGAHAPIVYFIRNGDRVKIGLTQNLRKRVGALCLRFEDVVLMVHGDRRHEQHLHERFADYRITGSEWFTFAGELRAFIRAASGEDPGASSASVERQNSASSDPEAGDEAGNKAGADVTIGERQQMQRPAAKRRKNTRRPMAQWVELAEPVFHAEFQRLQRQPTGIEFAQAIKKARLGTVSESTAKKIRTEIIDRAPLPSLDA